MRPSNFLPECGRVPRSEGELESSVSDARLVAPTVEDGDEAEEEIEIQEESQEVEPLAIAPLAGQTESCRCRAPSTNASTLQGLVSRMHYGPWVG